MANRNNNYGRNYNREPRRRRVNGWKAFALFLALIVIAEAITIAAAIGSKGFTIKDPNAYFDYWGKGAPVEEEQSNIGSLVIDPETITYTENDYYGSIAPMTLDIKSKSNSSQTVKATVYDVDGQIAAESFQKFVFSLAWASDNEEEVTEYMTLSATKNTATVTLRRREFTTTILLTCTNVANPELSATARLEYVRPVNEICVCDDKWILVNGDSVPCVSSEWIFKGDLFSDYWTSSRTISLFDGFRFVEKSGTINDGLCDAYLDETNSLPPTITVNFSFSNEFIPYLADLSGSDNLDGSFYDHRQTCTFEGYYDGDMFTCPYSLIEGLFDEAAINAFKSDLDSWHMFKTALAMSHNQLDVEVVLNMRYAGTVTVHYQLDISFSDYLSEVEIDENELYFQG